MQQIYIYRKSNDSIITFDISVSNSNATVSNATVSGIIIHIPEKFIDKIEMKIFIGNDLYKIVHAYCKSTVSNDILGVDTNIYSCILTKPLSLDESSNYSIKIEEENFPLGSKFFILFV